MFPIRKIAHSEKILGTDLLSEKSNIDINSDQHSGEAPSDLQDQFLGISLYCYFSISVVTVCRSTLWKSVVALS